MFRKFKESINIICIRIYAFLRVYNGIWIESIFIATDNDEAGNRAAEKLAELIPKEKFVYRFLPQAKDWNEDLVNEVRPIFRRLAEMAQNTNCAIVMIGHLNKTSGSQSTYRGFGSIDITAVERSLLFIGKVKNDPTTRVIVHEKSSLAPPGQSLAFSLGDEIDFRWIGAYDITSEDLLAGGEGSKTELKQELAAKLIMDFLTEGKKVSIAEINAEAKERGIERLGKGKYLTLEEAAAYSGIGTGKLREITNNEECNFVLWVGNKRLFKKRLFDKYLEQVYSI